MAPQGIRAGDGAVFMWGGFEDGQLQQAAFDVFFKTYLVGKIPGSKLVCFSSGWRLDNRLVYY